MRFSIDTSTDDKFIKRVKDTLITQFHVIEAKQLECEANLDRNGREHVSIFIVLDTSGSISEYLDDINNAVLEFVRAVVAPNSLAKEGIDFCYITFNDKVTIRRAPGYLKSRELDSDWITIDQSEIGGGTDIASALFTAWYLGEERKRYIKSLGNEYYQPTIILLSDLGHNRTKTIRDMSGNEFNLFDMMLELISAKRANGGVGAKLGMVEITPCVLDGRYSEQVRENAEKLKKLPVTILDTRNPKAFVDEFNSILRACHATIAKKGNTDIIHSDNDDDRIIKSSAYLVAAEEDDAECYTEPEKKGFFRRTRTNSKGKLF